MQKKTLLLSEIFPPRTGGSGRWFWEIYRRLSRDEFVLAVGVHPQQQAFDATHDLNVERLPLGMPQWGVISRRGLRDYCRHVWRLRKIARRYGVRQVHCGRCLPEGVMALLLKMWIGTPYLCYVHGEDVNTAANSREHAFLVRRVLHAADLCIANSHNTARLLQENWALSPARVHVLHPGVDTTYFQPADRSDQVRQKLGWGNRRVILTVGRLQRRKGQDMMIRALPAIRERIPDVLYSIVGDGEENSSLIDLAHECDVADAVDFHGETTDGELLECYQQCDLFALPNREINGDIEGFGMVLLEAQACGKPVLAGDSGGTAETMQEGVTGYIVDCRGPEPLAERVIDLLSRSDAPQMGSAARRRVVDNFDWDALARQASALFGTAARRKVQATQTPNEDKSPAPSPPIRSRVRRSI